MAYDFSGFLLGLLGAVLCPTLSWPRGTCSFTNMGAADGPIDWYLGDAGGRDAI
jgi:hypothetical protein